MIQQVNSSKEHSSLHPRNLTSYSETANYGPTRLCGKRVGRSPSRGKKPTEPSYSWLPNKWIQVQPCLAQLTPVLQKKTKSLPAGVNQRRYSSPDTGHNLFRRQKNIAKQGLRSQWAWKQPSDLKALKLRPKKSLLFNLNLCSPKPYWASPCTHGRDYAGTSNKKNELLHAQVYVKLDQPSTINEPNKRGPCTPATSDQENHVSRNRYPNTGVPEQGKTKRKKRNSANPDLACLPKTSPLASQSIRGPTCPVTLSLTAAVF